MNSRYASGNFFDIWFETKAAALAWGRRTVNITIYGKNTGSDSKRIATTNPKRSGGDFAIYEITKPSIEVANTTTPIANSVLAANDKLTGRGTTGIFNKYL